MITQVENIPKINATGGNKTHMLTMPCFREHTVTSSLVRALDFDSVEGLSQGNGKGLYLT